MEYEAKEYGEEVLINLLNILENLFFSMKIPEDIKKKYGILRTSAFDKLMQAKNDDLAVSKFRRIK